MKRGPDKVLTELSTDPNDNSLREFHWIHTVHLFSDALGLGHLDEGRWSLRHAWYQLALAFQQGEPLARDQLFVDALLVIEKVRDLLDNTVRRLRSASAQPAEPAQHGTGNTA